VTVALVVARSAGADVRAEAERQRAAAADRAATGWTWLLDGSAIPRDRALAALLDAVGRVDATVLASAVLGPGGELAPGHRPLPPQGDSGPAMKVAPLRVLPVRAVSGASLLVRGEGPEGASYAWTAQALRAGGGFLVPDSVADAVRPGPGYARLLVRPGLNGRERLRLAAEVLERRSPRRARSTTRSPG
jgi:hypothetical protein